MTKQEDSKKESAQELAASRREMITKLVWAAPAIVATAAVNARASQASGGGGDTGGCGP